MPRANYTTLNQFEFTQTLYHSINGGTQTLRGYPSYISHRNAAGGTLPNWRDRIERGMSATNVYTLSMSKVSQASGSMTRRQGAYTLTISGNGVPGLSVPSISWSEADRLTGIATSKALSRLRSGFSAGTFLGESKQALRMLRQPAMSLRKLTDQTIDRMKVYQYEAIRRGMRPQDVRNLGKALPDLYLEFQFGAKPLGADIANAYDAATRVANSPSRMLFSGTARGISSSSLNVHSGNTLLGRADTLRVSNVETSVRVKGAATLKLGFGMPAFAAGSTIPDFVPTLWNLMPWSFLIDYFTNIGRCLEARATSQLLNVAWITSSQKITGNHKFTRTFASDGSGAMNQNITTINFRRTNPSAFQLPAFGVSDKPLSTSQGLNIAALAVSRAFDLRLAKDIRYDD